MVLICPFRKASVKLYPYLTGTVCFALFPKVTNEIGKTSTIRKYLPVCRYGRHANFRDLIRDCFLPRDATETRKSKKIIFIRLYQTAQPTVEFAGYGLMQSLHRMVAIRYLL